MDLQDKIIRLKKEKNAVILAHYYQRPEIQEVADHIGDSLGLSQRAADTHSDIIVFAGVHFMAETAKILNPEKKVLLPDLTAGCSLADSCPPGAFRDFIHSHPDHIVLTYINCSAEIKAMSDYVCTSSNAEKIIKSLPPDRPILFAPDKNLGKYLIQQTGRELLLWDGSCVVHEAFSMDKLFDLYRKHPDAQIMAHPESESHILKIAHYIGSTAGMIAHAKKFPKDKFIVATEAGILHEMQKEVPGAQLIPAPSHEDNTCGCSECAFMKANTLEKLYHCLYHETPHIDLPKTLMQKASIPIERMLELSR
ncbi:quinolinate synthase NadA [Flagellimonas pelagia]|uniref:Quinolinate synthase n=1 Tax=Flagellimonas pelagia TaxID=2306998 RepID=A0A3A1NGN4_9FLAO|nr:quinolinate synthase NadA [Allomuricauda maritima]RIV44262.1 quinolinate synthase NadA [Allomuricauda maritima]TXJ94179.1 quinolinate synthase NadA [Allomuricauda maritima]